MTKTKIRPSIRLLVKSGRLDPKVCQHLDQLEDFEPNTQGCLECLELGDTWVHLRMCLTCGNVGCCDDSKNKHASKHHRASTHPVMTSLEPEDHWIYCYIDEIMILLD